MMNGANPKPRIRFVTPILPGKYTLRVRAISNEDKRVILEERSMDIVIAQPFWLTIWASCLCSFSSISACHHSITYLDFKKAA